MYSELSAFNFFLPSFLIYQNQFKSDNFSERHKQGLTLRKAAPPRLLGMPLIFRLLQGPKKSVSVSSYGNNQHCSSYWTSSLTGLCAGWFYVN